LYAAPRVRRRDPIPFYSDRRSVVVSKRIVFAASEIIDGWLMDNGAHGSGPVLKNW
jgi:hypothetical protein